MPAAAKIEKPTAAASGEITNGKGKPAPANGTTTNGNSHLNNSTNTFQDPQKIANGIIEKKIRNLEKRKARLLEIKALEDKGQQLEADQKVAVKKLEGVIEMIDMLKDIGKNVTDGLNEYSKQLKKQQKREQSEKQIERQQQDAERVKLWLSTQFILSRFALAKNDLLQGENGAVKLEENQVDALGQLVDLLSPQSLELIDSSVEKVNYLLEGNKREFTTGVSYSVLKEMILNLIESKYFENVTVVNNEQANTSGDNEEQSPAPVETEPVPVIEPTQNDSQQEPDEHVEPKPQPVQPNNNVHHLNQLCFMRDPIVENELQHKDPAVVAVGASGFAFQPQLGQALPASSGSNIATSNTISSHYSAPITYPLASIPTQTFTNPSYQFIPVSMPTSIYHQMPIPEQQVISMRNVGPDVSPIHPNEKIADQPTNEKFEQFSTEVNPKETSNLQPSQEGEGKPAINGQAVNGEAAHNNNGHYKRNNNRGGRGNQRGANFGGGNPNGSFRGRGGKPSGYGGYFNSGAGNTNANNVNGGGNFNSNRPMNNRQNGGGRSGGGPYRQDRGVPRNNANNFNNNNNQAAPVSAK